MNRQEALEWCVENLIQWPNGFMRIDETKWIFGKSRHDKAIVLSKGDMMSYITKQNWIDAKAKKESEDYCKQWDESAPQEEPQWQNGLPPVWVECEFSLDDENWHICKVLCYGSNSIFIKSHRANDHSDKEYVVPISAQFRPLKTEREKFIEMATAKYLKRVGSDAVNQKWFGRIFGAMHDEGARFND